ncbi:MAG TPA: peroxiredoxin [Candidatus Saccharimonadales bacterium]|nr:peroxiredoxin [Candidatus Saccharimonadales bacterium]
MKQAPNFSLKDQNGNVKTLTDFAGKWVVLYFYPKDQTPGCTAEACSFRDANESLIAKDAVVIGISKDSVESHANFIKNYKLPFTLLSDPAKSTIKAYGAWGKGFLGHVGTLRKTFIINPDGQIVHEFPKVTPATHASEILYTLEVLQAK